MRVWKTCPTGSRHKSHGRAQYKRGITVTPCDPDGPDNSHSCWLWACESL
jgi:hypothetical protein